MGEAKRRQFMQPCAYCGSMEGRRTDDHVPPTSLLLKPFPKRLTVPACLECNNGFSREMDQEFALFLSTWIGVDAGEARRFWRERVLPGLQADERRRRAFLEQLEPIFRREPEGHLTHLGAGVRVDARLVRGMLKRITRGLFFYAYREVLGDVPMQADLIDGVDEHLATFAHVGQVITVGDQFACMHGRVDDDPRGSFWIYQFHNGLFASVYTGSAAEEEAEAVEFDNAAGSLVVLKSLAEPA